MTPGKISELIANIMTAVSSCSLYSVQHQLVSESGEKALNLIRELLVNDALGITLLGDSLIINDLPFSEKGIHVSNFQKRLKKKKVEKILFKKGLEIAELRKFIATMASGEPLLSSPHLSIGILDIKVRDSEGDAQGLLNAGIKKVMGAYEGLSRFKKLDTVSLEDAVMSFISAMKAELNVLRIVSPVKTHNEYTYVHATNVSVLTIFQAEALGMKGELLHDIGIAGLLHDVGKLFVPNIVLDKQSKLDLEEWDQMKKHPVYGAMYLSKVPDIPPLASIVAYEHHMKFDGSGYPGSKKKGRTQHIVSQMVALADFFDALRTDRPYRKSVDVQTISGLMKEGIGKDFNPRLVDNFLAALGKITTIA